MGIFKAFFGAVHGAAEEQWLEAFTCDAPDMETLVLRGRRMQSERSANNGSDNVISAGSLILVPDGAAAIVTEMGKVLACYDTPGEHKFTGEKAKGVFGGGGLSGFAKDVGSRVGFGGDVAVTQRVYFVNTRESMNNPFSATSVPVRLYDMTLSLDMDAAVTLHGVFSYKITDPVLFYRTVTGNVAVAYTRTTLSKQLQAELVSALGPALSALCEQGIRPSDFAKYTNAVCERLADAVREKWRGTRGIEPVSLALDALSVVPKDLAAVQQAERAKMLTDPAMAGATLTGAAADAMRAAADNGAFRRNG